ncbi:tail fiber domain-containing protein [Bacteroides nordii]|uniref:tail fiber domain-containing protein n=2 Tax=Bacteroides nordii TaxID=291645 RepID=UPI001EDD6564|nr:tail fiber domain-containing protein [Bacteroides nordii]MCG4768523.1 tail fiber domain-containing protein [Bacteroides nordii]
MKSDYIQLSWSSDNSDTIPAGSYIEYKGEKYSLLEPYSPKQKDEAEFIYQPQFQSKIMIWGKTPFFMYTYTDDVITNREPDWSLTDNPANFMSVVVDAIKNETGEIWTYSVESSLPASTTQSFQSIDIFSALNQIANAFETEWWVDKVNKVIHLSKASHGDPVVLEVGENVNTPSVTSSKEGYYTRFYAFGSTRNIVQDYKGANVNNLVNKRLTLDPVKYPGGYKDIRDNLSSDEIFSKVLILDDIYPSSKLKISDVRVRLMWTIDPDTKEKVQIGTDNEGNPIYDQYAIWYFQIPGFFFDNTAYDKDTNPQGMLIPGKTLSAHFQNGPLSGREFELKYHDKAESVDSADGAPIQIKKGDYEILFVKEDSLVIPMINNLVPADGNEVVLFNIRMPEEYTTSAYLDLESALNKEIERLSSDLNNYQFNSNPVAFDNSNPKLSLGRNITYKNGTYSYSTRVIKLVTKLDFEIEQTITVGNEQIKGNTQEIKEEIASANKDINLLAILNSTTNSLTQAYSRTQQLMLEGFASIKDMWKFDPDNADTIFSKYNVYSKKALSAKGLAEGSGGSGGGASALYQLVDVIANSTGTGVEGAVDGSILKYDALANKWKAGEAGLNEKQLAFYLSTNNYAKKSDIPSLAGYATEKWVTDKGYLTATVSDKAKWNAAYGWGNHTLAGYAKQTDLNTVSDKLNSFLSGESISDTIDNWKEFQKVFENFPDSANMVELLRGKVDITTSVKAGTGLTGGGPLSKDITLSLGETGVSVGTYTKLTVDKYGRVTSGTSLIASDIPSLAISKITGLQDALNSKLNSNDFQSKFDAAIAAWFVRDEGNKGIRPAAYKGEEVGFYSNTYLSAKGRAAGSGGGGGGASALYQLLDVIPNASGTGVEGAVDKSVLTFDGTSGKWKAAKGLDEAALGDYLTTNKYATQGWVSSQGYLTQHQSLANYVTLNTDQNITGIKTFVGNNFSFYHTDGNLNIVQKSSYTGGWARGLNFKNDNDAQYAVIGGYGNANTFNYVYIGQSYDSRWITFASTGVKSSVDLEATKFKKTGGTSAQFLKADGSIDSNSYLTTVSASSTYVRKAGDIMTGALTVPNLVISRTDPVKHIAFSRADFNYITAPANGTIAFITKNVDVGASVSDFMISTGIIRPGTTNVVTNGNSSYRWSNVYSVLGNFSGVITAGSSINAAGTINSGANVNAENYIVTKKGWFQNDLVGGGLYNKGGDARWFYDGFQWYADKAVLSISTITGTRLVSNIANGTAPLIVSSSTMVNNLNSQYLGGYDRGRYVYHNAYSNTNGCLVRLTARATEACMITVHIIGNSYNAKNVPIDTTIQFYNYPPENKIVNPSAVHNGYNFGSIDVFNYDGQVYLWFKQTGLYQSFSIIARYTNGNGNYYGVNVVESITNAAKPTAEVTRSVTITPSVSALLTDNVASATKLANSRRIFGQLFDGTTDVSGEASGVTRVSNTSGSNLFLGNSDNTGFVQTSNMCASTGTTYWSLRTTGVGHFRRINLGDVENDDSNYRLAIAGNVYINGHIISPFYRINYSNTNPYYSLTKGDLTAHFQISGEKAYVGFGINGAINITQDGKVGIGLGATTPSYRLHVNGDSYFNGSLIISANNGKKYRISVNEDYNGLVISREDGTVANLVSTGGMSAKGYASGSGGSGGGLIQNVYGYDDLGKSYSSTDYTNTFNADTTNRLAARIASLEGGSALNFVTAGTGEFLKSVSKSGTTVTFTKGTPNYINSSTTERGVKPNATGNGLLKLYFLNGTQSGIGTGTYYDALYLSSYVDNSGGGSNLITFNKSNGEMAIHYQAFGAAAWGTRRVVLDSGNFANYAPTKTGGGASGSWGINITGNAATATNIFNKGTVTLATATESNAITITQPSYTTNQPVKLLNFNWYNDVWSIGNIRAGNTTSLGLGIFNKDIEIAKFNVSNLSVPALVIKSQNQESHIKFTRSNLNYITCDTSGLIGFVTNGKDPNAANSDVIISGDRIYPGTHNLVANGTDANRWKNVYSVLGNFSGAVTMSAGLNVTGSIVLATDWVRFSKINIGLYNTQGDARFVYDGTYWRADKHIYSTNNMLANQFVSNVATGAAPLIISSTTKVTNLHADLLDGYHATTSSSASTIVARDSSKYVYLSYINSDTNRGENGVLDQFICTNSSDNFYRKYSRDYVRVRLNDFINNCKTLDLTSLDQNTYYPCSVTISAKEPTTINIFVSLNSGSKPSWSTHTNGFTMNLSWQVFGGGWGTTAIQRKIFNYYVSSVTTGVQPCGGIEQNAYASTEIVYLRGGAKYLYTISNSTSAIAINTNGYSWSSGNYSYSAPTMSAPKKHPSLCYESNSMLGSYNIYCAYLQVDDIKVNGTVTAATYKSGKSMFQDGQLELSGATPYIDFHYNNSTADYTHRIIAATANRMDITTNLQVNGVLSTNAAYLETSNPGFKTGNVIFRATNTNIAEISSYNAELIFSGGGTMAVNVRASGAGRTIPTKWNWHRGAANTWADFEIGLLTTHASAHLGGDVTITDDLNVSGSTTFAGHVIAGMGLDVIDLTYLQDDLQVDGYSSFNSDVTINANLGMRGTIDLIGGTIRGDSKSKIICDGIGISTGNKESGCIISGNPSSWNIAFDHNDIQARNNGIMSVLYLNDYGGDVSITNASSAYGVKILSTKASTSYSNGALTVGGGIGVGGSIYTRGSVIADGAISAKSASDQRLKTNFDRNVRYDERLLSLGCVLDYNYNTLALQRGEGGVDRNRHTGLIYQNVERIMPHITYKSADGYGSINYISPDFIATIAGATQLNTLGLRSVVRNAASLEKRISLLEKENDKLKSEIKRLGGRI